MRASTGCRLLVRRMSTVRVGRPRTALVAGLAILALAVPALAQADPYTPSSSGYDTSYPECTVGSAPSSPSFAIIGVSHGRPFTSNTCAAAEWTLATSDGASLLSLYFNTGYAGAYQKDVTSGCAAASGGIQTGASGHQNSALQTAWAIGCSEAADAVAAAPGTPAVWWADIETGNSWSTNTALNQFAINGIVAELASTGIPVGVYSSPSMWNKIVGTGYVNPGIAADWQTGLSVCPSSPSTAGFTLASPGTPAPLWLAQTGTTTITTGGVTTSYDADAAC